MKALICTQCGAPINRERMICEYCGTRYEQTEDLARPLRITYSPDVRAQILQSQVAMDNQVINFVSDADEIARIVHSRITAQLAEALEPYVEYTVQEDLAHRRQVICGIVRVLHRIIDSKVIGGRYEQ